MVESTGKQFEERARKIRLLVLDVDGVLTDGTIYLSASGSETKSFQVRDGYGLKALMACGVEVALISGRVSGAVEHRARELGISLVFQGVKDKRTVCRRLMKQKNLEKGNILSMGDDLPDLALFEFSGICAAVADAAREVLEAADVITGKKGGQGAVREICEWILKLQGKWPGAVGHGNGK